MKEEKIHAHHLFSLPGYIVKTHRSCLHSPLQ
jgi:hypothetical protein